MTRETFIIVIAAILLVAFSLGWLAHWVLHRFGRVAGADMNDMERMAQDLHDAEEIRDQAVIYMQQRERELTNQLHQTEAELSATMDGLRNARHEVEELRAYIERQRQGG